MTQWVRIVYASTVWSTRDGMFPAAAEYRIDYRLSSIRHFAPRGASRERAMMERIRTSHGQFTDPEFEKRARQYFRDPRLRNLPGPQQVDRLLSEEGVPLDSQEWARAVGQRALIKVLLTPAADRARGQ
jgi:hypothetical protein